jgi:hypothetical protein
MLREVEKVQTSVASFILGSKLGLNGTQKKKLGLRRQRKEGTEELPPGPALPLTTALQSHASKSGTAPPALLLMITTDSDCEDDSRVPGAQL